jgi:hypothetical protein
MRFLGWGTPLPEKSTIPYVLSTTRRPMGMIVAWDHPSVTIRDLILHYTSDESISQIGVFIRCVLIKISYYERAFDILHNQNQNQSTSRFSSKTQARKISEHK